MIYSLECLLPLATLMDLVFLARPVKKHVTTIKESSRSVTYWCSRNTSFSSLSLFTLQEGRQQRYKMCTDAMHTHLWSCRTWLTLWSSCTLCPILSVNSWSTYWSWWTLATHPHDMAMANMLGLLICQDHHLHQGIPSLLYYPNDDIIIAH